MEKSVREAWVKKIERELEQILSAMMNPNDAQTKERVIEWLARSLKRVPIPQRDVKNTLLYRLAIFLGHSDVTSFKVLWIKLTPVLPVKASQYYLKKLLMQFDWKIPFDMPESKQFKQQQEPIKRILVNKGESPANIVTWLERIDSDNKAIVDLLEDLGKRIAKIEYDFIVVKNKTDEIYGGQPLSEEDQDSLAGIDLQLNDLRNSMVEVKLTLSVLRQHEHVNGKIMVPYEA